MMCVWEKGRSMKFLFMGKLLVIWRRGDYCPWQQFEQLGGTAHHRVPWSHSGFGDPYVSSAFIWAISSSILFPLLDNLCSKTRFYSLLVCDSLSSKEMGHIWRIWKQSVCPDNSMSGYLAYHSCPLLPSLGAESPEKAFTWAIWFYWVTYIFYVCWVHSLRCFSTYAERGKDKHLRKTFPCHLMWLM